MLTYLSELQSYFGPFRTFSSHLVLMGIGLSLGIISTLIFLPKFQHLLPTDRGREFAIGAAASKGKPQSAGVIFIPIFVLICLLVIPPSWPVYGCLAGIFIAMLTGFFDDAATVAWGRLKKGLLDVAVAAIVVISYSQFNEQTIWLPFIKEYFILEFWQYCLIAVPLLWLCINSTNCSDGIDGLAGSLSLNALLFLTGFLYIVTGHKEIANYLLIPHNSDGASWAILLFCMVGCLSAYLWHNCEPSTLMMGDAGSRALGLVLGLGILASGNPLLVVALIPVILINGGGGLVKLALLKILPKFGISVKDEENNGLVAKTIHRWRFPLHDHCRKNLGWKNSQVVMRFNLIQSWLLIILLTVFIKVR